MAKPTAGKATKHFAPPAKRITVKSDSYFSVYSNDVAVQTTPWDMRLILGEITDSDRQDQVGLTVKQVGEVRISPQLAKRLVSIMSDQLSAYEKQFGEIPSVTSASSVEAESPIN